jgi:enoyl-CoA hydratase
MTDTVLIERKDRIGILTINRPEALNAVSTSIMDQLVAAAAELDTDEGIGCIIVTGAGGKAFVAGADIKEMADNNYIDVYLNNFSGTWDHTAHARKPVVAAVAGFALGGGCELAMQCDVVIAADTAKFGQPEIKLGVIPGIGGTQRLTRAVGKAKAMDLILTGRMMDAAEAEKSGLVARVVPAADLVNEAMKVAEIIAGMSLPSVLAAKETVNRAFESSLAEGVMFERRAFHSLFATQDQKEGMKAFVEKRKPAWTNK